MGGKLKRIYEIKENSWINKLFWFICIINLHGDETTRIKNRKGRGMFKTRALSLCARSFLPINSFSKIFHSFWRSLMQWNWPLAFMILLEQLVWGDGVRACLKPSSPGDKKNPQRQALRGCVLIFYLSDISLADFSSLCISKSNTSGIRLGAVRVPMQWLLPSSIQ